MTGKTILAIDTDAETTQQIVSILEAEDYLVFTAPNGNVGIAMAKKVNPSLIFINPALSGTSGLEVCKTIHGTEQLKDIPIVVLSSFEGAMDQRYAEAYGIVDSLKKPFTAKELISKTGNVLSMEHGDIQTNAFQDFPSGEAEETIGFGAAEETVVMKQQMQERQTMPAEEFDASEKTMVKMEKETPEPFENTVVEDIPYTEPEEILKGETERAYKFKTNIRRRGMRSRLFVPLIVTIIIIVVIGTGVGLILYNENLLPWLKSSTSVPVKPVPAEKAAVAPNELQKPTGETVESKSPAGAPAVKPATPSDKPSVSKTAPAAPKTSPKPEPKQSALGGGKIIYHVQLGAFKNSNNAETLAKDYKAKGYETFIQKSAGKDKETLYRVLIGKFENKKEAATLAKNIEAKEKAKAVIFKE
ncbi:MAG: SPOR domain-containing protein [Nitrospirota bacterium]|nr:SPOR domain-containing protein [Nitrospirota bacterium]